MRCDYRGGLLLLLRCCCSLNLRLRNNTTTTTIYTATTCRPLLLHRATTAAGPSLPNHNINNYTCNIHSTSSSRCDSNKSRSLLDTVAMDNTNNTSRSRPPPNVDQMQQLLHQGGGGWEKCWEEGLTPWDLGKPTPVIVHLHQTGSLPKGNALFPGCGSGHDVVAIACPDRHVVGLDIAEKAIERAIALSAAAQKADYCTFLKVDFFTWQPAELFDLIFDYTFFCAIEPDMRSAWASQMRDLLKPNGELITLMFPISDHVGGPPYKVCVPDYEEVLHPVGFEAVAIVDNELAIGPRKGREKLGRWKKIIVRSLI